MASSSGEVSGGATKNPQKEIDDLLAYLDLREDELEDVVIRADEVTELPKEARWLAIAEVHTSRSFSPDVFIGKMNAIWNLSRDPNSREARENLFFYPNALSRRLEKVVHQGPWTFPCWDVLIEDYDGKEDPEQFVFGGLYVWPQIHAYQSSIGNHGLWMIWPVGLGKPGRCKCQQSSSMKATMSELGS
jgi:hypothetical protein